MPIPPIPWPGLVVGFAVALALLWVGLPIARRIDWVDYPDLRKCHRTPTPLIGGVAMYCGYVLGGTLLDATPGMSGGIMWTVATCIVIVGCLDDCWHLRPLVRLMAELGMAFLMTGWGGVLLHNLGNLFGYGIVGLGVWFVPFTMIGFVGVINAINMSDGLDGLAGGQSLVAFLVLLFLAVQAGRWQEVWWILLAVVVLIPFLLFNAPFIKGKDARVFMGDSGSMLLGLLLVWFTVTLTQGSHAACSPVVALWILAVPLIDMFSSIVRRLFSGHHPFASDTGHIHHVLLALGCNKQQVFLILVGTSTLLSLLAVTAHLLTIPDAILFYSFLALLGGYCWFMLKHNKKA
ncbi:MAG: undecaprenyl/decaprenyl-phosphate alpha-N-acetylglucosaminyl 1-phosphate transferase [Magnetococcus sp. MYC-9]